MLCAFGALCGRCRGQTGKQCDSSRQETGNLAKLACNPSLIEFYRSIDVLDFRGSVSSLIDFHHS